MRVQVDTTLPQVALDPVAAPVDTYVRPSVDQGSGADLMGLAKSLANFSGPLNDYVQAQQQKQAQDDAVSAQADFVKNNSAGYADAVEKGLIPASASPAYMAAYKKAQGDVAGQQLELDAIDAYNKSSAKNSLDPNAFSTFMTGFLKDRIQTTDPEVLKGLLPRIRATQQALLGQHIQDQDQLVRQGSENTLGAQVNGSIDSAHAAGLGDANGPNYGAAFDSADQHWQDMVKTGMNPDKASTIIEQAVTEQALSKKDSKILDWFDRKVPGQDYTYKSTPDGQKAYNDAVEKLDIIQRRDKVEQHQIQEAADKAAKNKNEADTLQFIISNPNAAIPDALIKEGIKYNGTYQAQVLGWQKTVRDNQAITDPTARAEINRKLMDDPAGAPQYVIDGFKAGSLSAGDFQTDYKFAQEVQKNAGEYGRIVGSDQVKQGLQIIQQQTSSSEIDMNAHPGWLSPDGLRAQSDYRRQILGWVAQNPQDAKDPIKLNSAIEKITAGVLKNIQPTTLGQSGTYTAPGTGQGNPFGANPPPPAPPAPAPHVRTWGEWWNNVPSTSFDPAGNPLVAPPATPGQPPAAPPVAPQVVAPPVAPATPQAADPKYQQWYQGLGDASRKSLDDAAAKMPDPEGFKRRVMERFRQSVPVAPPAAPGGGTAPDGTPVDKSSFVPQGNTSAFSADQSPGSLVDAALRDPHGALSAIQQAVSGSNDALGQATADQALADKTSSDFEAALHPSAGYQATSTVSDKTAGSILDFVAQPESKGNYNARFGNAKSTEDLSRYSLNDILDLQRVETRSGSPSSAIGRYQFIRGTLLKTARSLGLSGDEKFTPELQDRLAMELLRQRGYDDWKSGNLTDQQFANNLAKEWASLPVIGGRKHGRSFYAGDGLNRAGVSPGSVLRLLET